METKRPGIARTTTALSIAVALLAAGLVIVSAAPPFSARTITSTETVNYPQNYTTIITLAPSTSESTECTILAVGGPLYLSVLNDSSKAPVVGAKVNATNVPSMCDHRSLDNNFTVLFTTGDSRSYLIGGGSDSSFSIAVHYTGHTYDFLVQLAIEAATCATLYLPSGRTNITSAGTFNLTC